MKLFILLFITSCSKGMFTGDNKPSSASSSTDITLNVKKFYGYGSLYSSFSDGSQSIVLATGTLAITPAVYVEVINPTNIDESTLMPSSFSCDNCTINNVTPVYNNTKQLLGFIIDLFSPNAGDANVSLTGVKTTDGNFVMGDVPVTFIGDAQGDNTPSLSLVSLPTTPQASLNIEIPPGFTSTDKELYASSIVCNNCTVTAISGSGPYVVTIVSNNVLNPTSVSIIADTFTNGTSNTVISNIVNINFSNVAPVLIANAYADYGSDESSYLAQPIQDPQEFQINQPTAGIYFQVISPNNIDPATLVSGSFSCGVICTVGAVDVKLDIAGNVSGFIVHVSSGVKIQETLTSSGIQDLSGNSLLTSLVNLSFLSPAPIKK